MRKRLDIATTASDLTIECQRLSDDRPSESGVRAMGAQGADPRLRVEVSGPYDRMREAPPPPEYVEILRRSASAGLDAQTIEHLVLMIDWAAVSTGVGIHLFSQWLYEKFRRPPRDEVAARGTSSKI